MMNQTKKWIGFALIFVALGVSGCDSNKKSPSIEEVRQDVTAILDYVKLQWGHPLAITHQDQFDIQQDGNDYIVTIKNLNIKQSSDAPEVSELLGEISTSFDKVDFALSYKDDNQINIKLKDAQLTSKTPFSATREKFEFVWSKTMNNFIFANILFKNGIYTHKDGMNVKIDTISFNKDYKEDTKKNILSGHDKMMLDNIHVESPQAVFSIKNIETTLDNTMVNMKETIELTKEMAPKVQEWQKKLQETETKDPQALLAFFCEIFSDDRIYIPFDGSMSFIVKDTHIQTVGGEKGEKIDLKLPEFKISAGMNFLNYDQAAMEFEFSNKDATSPQTTQMGIDPLAFKLQFGFKNIPVKPLIKELIRVKDNKDVDYKTMITNLFVKSGAVFTVDAINLDVGSAHLTTKGDFKANEKAVFGVEGQIDISLMGLDDLLTKFPAPQEAKAVIEIAKGFSKRETKDGKDVFVYTLSVSQDGKVLLNNMDWTAIQKALPFFETMKSHPAPDLEISDINVIQQDEGADGRVPLKVSGFIINRSDFDAPTPRINMVFHDAKGKEEIARFQLVPEQKIVPAKGKVAFSGTLTPPKGELSFYFGLD